MGPELLAATYVVAGPTVVSKHRIDCRQRLSAPSACLWLAPKACHRTDADADTP